MKNKQKFHFIFLAVLIANLFFAQLSFAQSSTPVYSGVQQGIEQYLCHPSDQNTQGGDLYQCINRIYKLSLIVASVLGMLYMVMAGYVYMSADGSQEAVDKAKNMITTTLTALVILFAGFVLLNTINPDLVKFQPIQSVGGPTFPPGGGGPTTTPVTGTTAQLAQQILNSSNVTLATTHVACVQGNTAACNDGATARQNIIDTAAGKQAARSSYTDGGLTAPGGTVALSSNMLSGLASISQQYSISVSEIAGGVHSATSRHYKGTAFDINYINGTHVAANTPDEQAVKAMCKSLGATEVLGPEDAAESGQVVHCAW